MIQTNTNSYDYLLAGIYTGFVLSAILNSLLLKLYGLKGLPVGILMNAVMHITFLEGISSIDRGKSPPLIELLIAVIYFLLITSITAFATYNILRKKHFSPEVLTAINLFLCSVFFWELAVPAFCLLIVLLLPSREERAY